MSSIIKQANLLFSNNSPVRVSGNPNGESSRYGFKEQQNKKDKETEELILEDSYSRKKEELEMLLLELEKEVKVAREEYENALKEADTVKEEALKEAEGIKNAAYEEGKNNGYNEGISEAKKELEDTKARLYEELNNDKMILEEERKKFVSEVEKKVPELVKELFFFNFERECHVNDEVMQALVLKALSDLSDEKNVRVLLAGEDYEMLDKESLMKKITTINDKMEISFSHDKKLKKGSVLIETNLGYIDAGINALGDTIMALVSENISCDE